MSSFAQNLRHWRSKRHLSQLVLAAEAGVSARHVSFLESGRARPSRDMVLTLAEALQVPLPERNTLLESAGFAALYRRRALDDAALGPVRAGMEHMLSRHDPYPAVLMDRLWRVLRLNKTATLLFGASGLGEGDDLLALLCAPGRGAEMVENWGEVGHHLARRLRHDSRAAGGVHALERAAAAILSDPVVAAHRAPESAGPFVPTIYRGGGMRLALFSTIAQFSGADDLTLSDLQIELMFPADAASEALLQSLG
jgi:transcriptional regulator with XRE-family HTH domain